MPLIVSLPVGHSLFSSATLTGLASSRACELARRRRDEPDSGGDRSGAAGPVPLMSIALGNERSILISSDEDKRID